MREELLGYLLGALDKHEHEEIESRLEQDPQLRSELDRLGEDLKCLGPRDEVEAPPDLGRRTCEFVAFRAHVLAMNQIRAATSRWQLQDLVIAAGVFVAAALLFFPAVNQSRFAAKLAACQNNLRAIGQALLAYSQHQGGYFPYVPAKGNLAVAGIYGPTLVETGFLKDKRHLVCPQSMLAASALELPKLSDIQSAEGAKLRQLQALAGGSYGYTIGHLDNGRYRGTKNLSRPGFALVADAPRPQPDGWQSDNHGRCWGQNVFFEDGHVALLKSCTGDTPDHIFVNDRGVVGPGRHADDSVICNSGLPGRLIELEPEDQLGEYGPLD